MLKKVQLAQPQNKQNTVMLKKFNFSKQSAPGPAIDARICNFLNFLSITVLREFQGWKFGIV